MIARNLVWTFKGTLALVVVGMVSMIIDTRNNTLVSLIRDLLD